VKSHWWRLSFFAASGESSMSAAPYISLHNKVGKLKIQIRKEKKFGASACSVIVLHR
jgi:hypothetical protein